MSLADDIEMSAREVSTADTTKKRTSLADDIESAHTDLIKNQKTAKIAESYSPVGSNYENFAAGTGKAVADLGRGAGQILRSGLGDSISDKLGLTTTADVDEAKQRDAALMKTKAGVTGNIGGAVATSLIPFGLAAKAGVPLASMLLNPTTYTAAAASGAINGALQPTGTGDNRMHNTALGGVAGLAGNGLANTIGRIAQPIKNTLSAGAEKSLQILRNAGVPIDTAQATGSSFLNSIKSTLTDNPFTKGAQHEAGAVQQAAFNRAVLKTIGEDAHAGTSDVMGPASQRINGVFKDVLDRNNIHIKDNHVSDIADIQRSALDNEKGPVSNLANRLMSFVREDGTASGQNVYNIKKDLDSLASSPDTTLAKHARDLRTTVMNAVHESLPPTDQAAFSQARQQFANMKRIEPALDKAGTGNISPATLANVFSQKANRAASIYGKGDQTLLELAQAGKQMLGDKLPNSGTTARAALQLGLPLLAGTAAGGTAGYNGDYEGAVSKGLLGAGAMIAGPKLAQKFINSQGANGYFTQGMKNMMLRDVLQSPQNQSLVGGALRRLPGASVAAQ